MIRYFRTTAAVYEQVRRTLDAAWGYPDEERRTDTAIRPAARCPRDTQGRVYLSVPSEFCEFEAVAGVLPNLLTLGAVEELSAGQYDAFARKPRRA